jgi:HEAT repeat protein
MTFHHVFCSKRAHPNLTAESLFYHAASHSSNQKFTLSTSALFKYFIFNELRSLVARDKRVTFCWRLEFRFAPQPVLPLWLTIRGMLLWLYLLNLRSPSASLRRHAAKRLASFRKKRRVIPGVIHALHDRDPRVRLEAELTLKLVAHHQTDRVAQLVSQGKIPQGPGAEALIDATKDQDASCRSMAVSYLGNISSDRALAAVASLVKDDPMAFVRKKAVRALEQQNNKQAIEPLHSALADKNKCVRYDAAFALAALRDQRSVPMLLCSLVDLDETIRSQAQKILTNLCGAHWERSEAVRSAVGSLDATLQDEDRNLLELRHDLLRSPTAWDLKQRRETRRMLIIELIAQIDPPRGIELILGALTDEEPRVQRAAKRALTRTRDFRVVRQLGVLLEDDDADLRNAAAEALISINNGAAAKEIALRLATRNAPINNLALAALGKMPGWERFGEVLDIVPTLVNSLRTHKGDRTTVLRALSNIDHPAVFPGFLAEARLDARGQETALIDALCSVLTRSPEVIAEPDLRAAAYLKMRVYLPVERDSGDLDINYDWGDRRVFRDVDCSPVHRLARQELARRGIDLRRGPKSEPCFN